MALSAASAQTSTAGLVLVLPTSARALGLADAAGASAADEWALFAAPGQLSAVRTLSIGVASESYLASTRLSAAAVAIPFGRGTIGVGATMLDYGSIQEIASSTPGGDGTETGRTYSAQESAVVVGYGRSGLIGDRFGVTVELVNSHVADLSGNSVAISAGTAWSWAKGWNATASVQHLGNDLTLGATTTSLPAGARLAIAAPERAVGSFAVRPMVEFRDRRGMGSELAGGAEANWRGTNGTALALRGGYTWQFYGGSDRAPFVAGAGATFGPFGLDYAFEGFRTINQVTHRFGFRWTGRRAP